MFSYPGQEQIHLQLSHPPAQTRPDPKAEWHRPERVLLGLLLRHSEPALWQEGVGVRENVLIIGHSVVAQVEQRLREMTCLLQCNTGALLHTVHTCQCTSIISYYGYELDMKRA